MTDYKKLLRILNKICTVSDFTKTNRNKVIDIQSDTEDSIINENISNLLDCFNKLEYYKNKRMSLNVCKYCEIAFRIINDLKVYCKEIVRSDKPEWMILAERNGWRPPS